MSRFVIAIALVVASAVGAYATENGITTSDQPAEPYQGSPADQALIEAWNDNGAPGSTSTYASPCFAFQYIPGVSYLLERIEWYAGNIGGQVRTTVRDGSVTGPDLATTGYYMESPPRDWQGMNLQTPVQVTAGSTYGLVYEIVVGAQVSGASTGVIIPHFHDPSGACTSFNGPFNSLPWRARFYGQLATPTDASTWGNIKSIYR